MIDLWLMFFGGFSIGVAGMAWVATKALEEVQADKLRTPWHALCPNHRKAAGASICLDCLERRPR